MEAGKLKTVLASPCGKELFVDVGNTNGNATTRMLRRVVDGAFSSIVVDLDLTIEQPMKTGDETSFSALVAITTAAQRPIPGTSSPAFNPAADFTGLVLVPNGLAHLVKKRGVDPAQIVPVDTSRHHLQWSLSFDGVGGRVALWRDDTLLFEAVDDSLVKTTANNFVLHVGLGSSSTAGAVKVKIDNFKLTRQP